MTAGLGALCLPWILSIVEIKLVAPGPSEELGPLRNLDEHYRCAGGAHQSCSNNPKAGGTRHHRILAYQTTAQEVLFDDSCSYISVQQVSQRVHPDTASRGGLQDEQNKRLTLLRRKLEGNQQGAPRRLCYILPIQRCFLVDAAYITPASHFTIPAMKVQTKRQTSLSLATTNSFVCSRLTATFRASLFREMCSRNSWILCLPQASDPRGRLALAVDPRPAARNWSQDEWIPGHDTQA